MGAEWWCKQTMQENEAARQARERLAMDTALKLLKYTRPFANF
jgi:hypothetical protein